MSLLQRFHSIVCAALGVLNFQKVFAAILISVKRVQIASLDYLNFVCVVCLIDEYAVEQATIAAYLRPNAVDTLSGKNSGNNLGDDYFPSIHFQEVDQDALTIELILKGGGCENVGTQYALPNTQLGAGRDMEGVRKVILDAVYKAQGKGCAPGILGIAIGGDRGSSYIASKETLFRQLDDEHSDRSLAEFEERVTEEANQLGIGPMGFGGRTTVLGTKISSLHRLPASYFVTVSYMCWAYRRRKMVWINGNVKYS